MTIIMTKPEFEALPDERKWAIVYNLQPEPEPKPEPKPESKPDPKPEPPKPVAEGFWN